MLTVTQIQKAKASEKAIKLTDERGLYLLINPTGSKLWRWKYRFDGKEKSMAFGAYPDVSLAQARDKRDEARKKLATEATSGRTLVLLSVSPIQYGPVKSNDILS